MFDVIVVGARCSGAATAMLLSRRGFRVLLVDRMTFPSDTLSTLYIHPPGVALLREWGVLPAVVASGCPRLDRSRYEVGGVRLDSGPFSGDASYAPRRRVLDQILVDAAVAAGAEFRAGCRVTGPVWAGATPDNRTELEQKRARSTKTALRLDLHDAGSDLSGCFLDRFFVLVVEVRLLPEERGQKKEERRKKEKGKRKKHNA